MSDRFLNYLQEHNIPHKLHTHPPLRTVADMVAHLPFPLDNMLKTVVFRIKDGDVILAAALGKDRIDYKKVATHLGISRRALRALSAENTEATLNVEVGGVAPIALDPNIHLLIDNTIDPDETVYCGSGKRTVTLEIKLRVLIDLSQATVISISRNA